MDPLSSSTRHARGPQWLILPDCALIAFAREDDYYFGILHSRIHEVWGLTLGTRLETRPRYTPTTCFETFPFPRSTPAQEKTITESARALDEARRNWLGDRSDKKRTLTALYNERPTWLRDAHRKLDRAVSEAYGWGPNLDDSQLLDELLKLNLSRASTPAAPTR